MKPPTLPQVAPESWSDARALVLAAVAERPISKLDLIVWVIPKRHPCYPAPLRNAVLDELIAEGLVVRQWVAGAGGTGVFQFKAGDRVKGGS